MERKAAGPADTSDGTLLRFDCPACSFWIWPYLKQIADGKFVDVLFHHRRNPTADMFSNLPSVQRAVQAGTSSRLRLAGNSLSVSPGRKTGSRAKRGKETTGRNTDKQDKDRAVLQKRGMRMTTTTPREQQLLLLPRRKGTAAGDWEALGTAGRERWGEGDCQLAVGMERRRGKEERKRKYRHLKA